MNRFYIQAICTASMGGMLYGYDMGVISGSLPLLSLYFQLTPSQADWIVSLLYFGGGVGAATGGFITDWLGRKSAILITDVVFGIGAIILSSAYTVKSLMIGRFVVGWAVAVSGIADVAYLNEISSVWEKREGEREDGRIESEEVENADSLTAENGTNTDGMLATENAHTYDTGGRGSVVSVNEACISLGFLLAYAVAAIPNEQVSNSWRVMFGISGLLAAFQFFGMLYMPESSVWLEGKGRQNDADSARNKLRGTFIEDSSENTAQNRNETIIASQSISPSSSGEEVQTNEPSSLHNFNATEFILNLWIQIRSAPSQMNGFYRQILPYKRQCIIAFFLATSQQFCGHASILSFAPEIFAMLGQSPEDDAVYAENVSNSTNAAVFVLAERTLNGQTSIERTSIDRTVGIGLLKFLTTCVVSLYVDRGGRRLWFLSGMSCILLSLIFLCISFIGRDEHGSLDNTDDTQKMSSSWKNQLGIVGIYGVAIGYAASYGPLTWLIVSELFPSSIRGRALGFATVVTYMAAGLVLNTFLSIQEEFGLFTCFALYCTSTLLSIVFVWFGVPETGGGMSSEEIGIELNRLWIWGGSSNRHLCSRSCDVDISSSTQIPSTVLITYESDASSFIVSSQVAID